MSSPALLTLRAAVVAGAFACAAHAQAPRAPAPPPGLVFVPGGRTRIGIEVSALKRQLEIDPESERYAGLLSAETPAHEVVVESFFLMATEVTNEQYAAFVAATGARPPHTWGSAAIEGGRERWLAEREAARVAAIAAGEPAPAAEAFDARAWWREHWPGLSYAVPPGDERRPVVFVDWSDAHAYARWAGLRLPTEFEYQRAARGDTTRTYPWGDEWDSERFAATSLLKKKSGAFVVGSFPAGASKQGVFDLAGNVWEWTASPFTPYPGYEVKVYEFGHGNKVRQVNAVANWNPLRRVVVGGSFQNGSLMARATTRRSTEVGESSDGLGFRCAASVDPGVDIAQAILADELTTNARPFEEGRALEFAPRATTAAQCWDVAARGTGVLQAYALTSRHRYVSFTPVEQLACSDLGTFERATLERLSSSGEPLVLGFLATNLHVKEPALQPGTYYVAYRAHGVRRAPGGSSATPPASVPAANGEREPTFEERNGLDPANDWLMLTRIDGTVVAAWPQHVDWVSLQPGRALVVDTDAAPRTDLAPADERTLRLELTVASKTSRKGAGFTLNLRCAAAELDGVWRTAP